MPLLVGGVIKRHYLAAIPEDTLRLIEVYRHSQYALKIRSVTFSMDVATDTLIDVNSWQYCFSYLSKLSHMMKGFVHGRYPAMHFGCGVFSYGIKLTQQIVDFDKHLSFAMQLALLVVCRVVE